MVLVSNQEICLVEAGYPNIMILLRLRKMEDVRESADHFTFKEDGTLVFSSSEGHAGGTYDKAETAEEARYNRSKYYLEKDLFIVEKDTYTRTK